MEPMEASGGHTLTLHDMFEHSCQTLESTRRPLRV